MILDDIIKAGDFQIFAEAFWGWCLTRAEIDEIMRMHRENPERPLESLVAEIMKRPHPVKSPA